MMVEVLEVRHHQFETALSKAETLDNVLEYHAEFLDTCLKECLLSHHELLRCVTKIMSVCLLFSEQMEHFSDVNRLEEVLLEDRIPASSSYKSREVEKKMLYKPVGQDWKFNRIKSGPLSRSLNMRV